LLLLIFETVEGGDFKFGTQLEFASSLLKPLKHEPEHSNYCAVFLLNLVGVR